MACQPTIVRTREKPDTHAIPAECSGSSVQLEADNRGKVKGGGRVYGDGPGAGDPETIADEW